MRSIRVVRLIYGTQLPVPGAGGPGDRPVVVPVRRKSGTPTCPHLRRRTWVSTFGCFCRPRDRWYAAKWRRGTRMLISRFGRPVSKWLNWLYWWVGGRAIWNFYVPVAFVRIPTHSNHRPGRDLGVYCTKYGSQGMPGHWLGHWESSGAVQEIEYVEQNVWTR